MSDSNRLPEPIILPPGFHRQDSSGLLAYRDDLGVAVLSADMEGRTATIYELAVNTGGRQGNGQRLVTRLHAFFDHLEVVDPGEPTDTSRLFWDSMQTRGLVDTLMDEDMCVLCPASPGLG